MRQGVGLLDFNAAVRQALDERGAVLALESTIITHGMPWPDNLETARQVEQAVRDQGAVPATIAIMDGRLKVGLDDHQLERLARSGQQAIKCSRRDIAFALHRRSLGATTVAATMMIAASAGIGVFATGGIGGVHRGAAHSMDISADLPELARTDVAVVCAGPKAILDIGLTLQYLETHGVPVVGYRTSRLPAFYTADSGFDVDYRLDSAAEIAEVIRLRHRLGLSGGLLITNPIPAAHALDGGAIEQIIQRALDEASELGLAGKDVTPHLLARVAELSGGDSLAANVALVLNNARLGAQIALALADAGSGL